MMINQTPWFERTFPKIDDPGQFPGLVERLSGTFARLTYKLKNMDVSNSTSDTGKWSIKKEIGHLTDLEPLWKKRVLQILLGEDELIAADLSNRKTHETDHDAKEINVLLEDFQKNRDELIKILDQVKVEDMDKVALHPRLKTPMNLNDLLFFVAEHDDHHLSKISQLLQS